MKKKDNAAREVQRELLFHVETQIEHDGVEMGVLDNGSPYLTESGLARMCGIDRKALYRISNDWSEAKEKPSGKIINKILNDNGYHEDHLYLKSENKGVTINAYTEPVCMSLLEYYAFESKNPREQAIKAYRTLSKNAFRDFIYKATGYDKNIKNISSWQHYHDRVDITMDSVPDGYYCVFREGASIIVPLIKNGVLVSDKTIPDISIGIAWALYWRNNKLDKKYGKRIRFEHNYPEYYPQAKSNPQYPYAYSNESLAEFRRWLKEDYLNYQLPRYLKGQVKKKTISSDLASNIIDVFTPKQIPLEDDQ